MIAPCTCPANKSPAAEFQSTRYGGQRVWTDGGKTSRCTICGASRQTDTKADTKGK